MNVCLRSGGIGVLAMTLGAWLVAAQVPMPEAAPRLALLDVVEMTLAHDPNVALALAQERFARGAVVSARGVFDPVLSSDVTYEDSEVPVDAAATRESESVTSSVALEQLLRTGLTVAPTIDLERFEGTPDGSNQAAVSFLFRQPLLRGRGRAVTTADERAAERQLAASHADLRHLVAERIVDVVTRYWAYKAAAENLEILRASEESSRTLLETTRRLIEANVTPAAELVQLQADLASKQSARIAAERALFEARQALGREIGLELPAALFLPLAGDPFPKAEAAAVPEPAAGIEYVALALARRADLEAARQRRTAAEIRRLAAENALAPRLDLVFTPSYAGLNEGGAGDLPAAFFDNVPGLSATLGLSFSWPLRNRRAEGDLTQARALLEQSVLRQDLVDTAIGAGVAIALESVRQNAYLLDQVEVAVGLFEQTVEHERKKLRAGRSTLIDVVTQRDRLTAVQQQYVTARRNLALAILDLRFQTGTLVAAGDGTGSVGYENLTTLPDPELWRSTAK